MSTAGATGPGVRPPRRWRILRWGSPLVAVLGATIVAKLFEPIIAAGSPFALAFIFLAAVLGTAFAAGIGPAVLAVLAGAPAIAYVLVSSSAPAHIEPRDLGLQLAFFAASSLLAAGLIHAAGRGTGGSREGGAPSGPRG